MITQPSIFVWVAAAAILVIAAFNSWMSRINQFFFFSRTVPAGFPQSSSARAITRAYLVRVWQGFASAMLILFVTFRLNHIYVYRCFACAALVQCFFACAAFARAHRDTGKIVAELSPADQQEDLPASTLASVPLLESGAFTPRHMLLLFLAPATALIISIAAFLAAHLGWQQFLDAIDANKAEFLTGLGLGLMGGSLVLYVQLRYFSRHRSPMGRFTANGCIQMSWLGAVAFSLSTASVPLHLPMTKQVKGILLGIILAIALLRVLYGWSRARLFPPPQFERNGDAFWLWGLFYYNPTDPTLFIQHRSGPGYTVNFANRIAWPLTALIVADFCFLFFLHPHR